MATTAPIDWGAAPRERRLEVRLSAVELSELQRVAIEHGLSVADVVRTSFRLAIEMHFDPLRRPVSSPLAPPTPTRRRRSKRKRS